MQSIPALPLIFACGIAGSPGLAQMRSEEECLRLRPDIVSPVEMTICTSDSDGAAQALATVLADLGARLPDADRATFDRAQQAWVRYRDAECIWEAGGNPGSTGNSAAIIACTADMNRARAERLKQDLKER